MKTLFGILILLLVPVHSSFAGCAETCDESSTQACANLMAQEAGASTWSKLCSAPVDVSGKFEISGDEDQKAQISEIQAKGGTVAVFISGGKDQGFLPYKAVVSGEVSLDFPEVAIDARSTLEIVSKTSLVDAIKEKASELSAQITDLTAKIEVGVPAGVFTVQQEASLKASVDAMSRDLENLTLLIGSPESVKEADLGRIFSVYGAEIDSHATGSPSAVLRALLPEVLVSLAKADSDYRSKVIDLYLRALIDRSVDPLFEMDQVLGDMANAIDSDIGRKAAELFHSGLKEDLQRVSKQGLEKVPSSLANSVLSNYQVVFSGLMMQDEDGDRFWRNLRVVADLSTNHCDEVRAGMAADDGLSCKIPMIFDGLFMDVVRSGRLQGFGDLDPKSQVVAGLIIGALGPNQDFSGENQDPADSLVSSDPELLLRLDQVRFNAIEKFLNLPEASKLLNKLFELRVLFYREGVSDAAAEQEIAGMIQKIWGEIYRGSIAGEPKLYEILRDLPEPQAPGIKEAEDAALSGASLGAALAVRHAREIAKMKFFDSGEGHEAENSYGDPLMEAFKWSYSVEQGELMSPDLQNDLGKRIVDGRSQADALWLKFTDQVLPGLLKDMGNLHGADFDSIQSFMKLSGPIPRPDSARMRSCIPRARRVARF